MRDLILFVLILIFSASMASFAPSSKSIGALPKSESLRKKEIPPFRPTSAPKPTTSGDLKKTLDEIEVRCRSLENILERLDADRDLE